jgi:hypothetical protein
MIDMKKRILIFASVLIISAMLLPYIVMADSSVSLFTIVESSGNNYAMLPMISTIDNSILVSQGKIAADGLDTEVLAGSTSIPHMLTTDKTLFAYTIGANSTNYFSYSTKSTPDTSMPIIVGQGGYITTTDNGALEPANNFSIAVNGYVNTTAGASENIVNKANALLVSVDPSTSGTINVSTYNALTSPSQAPTGAGGTTGLARVGAATNWQAAATNDGSTSYVYCNTGTSTSAYDTYAITSSLSTANITSVVVHIVAGQIGGPPEGADAKTELLTHSTLYAGASNLSAIQAIIGSYADYSTTYTTNPNTGLAWTTAEVNAMQIGCWSYEDLAGGVTRITQVYAVVNYYPIATVSVAGVSSGIHTITVSETAAAGGTLSLRVDSGTASTVTGAGRVQNTANDWIVDQNNVMPYINYYTETVSGAEVLKYQPNAIISGTTLPDRDGTQNGAITFGSNPVGIAETNTSPPSVDTLDATSISTISAALSGNLTDSGGYSSVSVYFEYGLTSGMTLSTSPEAKTSAPTPFNYTVINLSPGETYYFRSVCLYGTNLKAYGSTLTFDTVAMEKPSAPANPTNSQIKLGQGQTYLTRLGPTVSGWLDTAGTWVGTDGRGFGGGLTFLVLAIIMLILSARGYPVAGLALGYPLQLAAAWCGVWDWAFVGVTTFIFALIWVKSEWIDK